MLSAQPLVDHTGSSLWIGGRLLAGWLAGLIDADAEALLHQRSLLELGCGNFALPARVAALRGAAPCLASDGANVAVEALQEQLKGQPEEKLIDVARIGWADEGLSNEWDVVIFADAVYSVEKAVLLAHCCANLLKKSRAQENVAQCQNALCGKHPCVLGLISTGRAGVADLIAAMRTEGFCASVQAISAEVQKNIEPLWCSVAQGEFGASLVGEFEHCEYWVVRWTWSDGEGDTEGEQLEQELRTKEIPRRLYSYPRRPDVAA